MVVRIKNIKNGRFSIELAKSDSDEGFYVIHGNKIVDGSNGRFISGPSFKGSDDKWVNQTWMDSAFQEYVISLVDAAMPQEPQGGGMNYHPDDSIPF